MFVWGDDVQGITAIATSFIPSFQITKPNLLLVDCLNVAKNKAYVKYNFLVIKQAFIEHVL